MSYNIAMRCLVACLALLSGCAAEVVAPQAVFGPTQARREASGYTLTNRQLTMTIDPNEGWAMMQTLTTPNGDKVLPSFDGLPPSQGYVEARDDETWQFIGKNASSTIGWRIIYCLHLDGASVSYIVQNNSTAPITSCVKLPAVRSLAIQPFNENPMLNHPTQDGSVRSDEQTIKPGERMSFTTRWTMREND